MDDERDVEDRPGASDEPGTDDEPERGRSGRRPAGVDDGVVEGIGKASEGFEYLVRARGHLYSMHQLIGRADFLFEEAADLLDEAGLRDDAEMVRRDIVGRNVLDGRWTFQIVEEFDDLFYRPIDEMLSALERQHLDGQRHVYESELKDDRRSTGRRGHERRPPSAHSGEVDVESADVLPD